jgi:hypothetical protein
MVSPACGTFSPMKTKDYLVVALAPLAVLLIPLAGNLGSEEWNWSFSDFVVAWTLLAGAIFTYKMMATKRTAHPSYRAGAALAVATGLLLTWINLAVQIIGDENPAFVLYFVVVLIGLAGAIRARFEPAGMANAALVTAAATFLVPLIAFILWPADFSPGVGQVFALNFGFVALFASAGLLFRHASRENPAPRY